MTNLPKQPTSAGYINVTLILFLIFLSAAPLLNTLSEYDSLSFSISPVLMAAAFGLLLLLWIQSRVNGRLSTTMWKFWLFQLLSLPILQIFFDMQFPHLLQMMALILGIALFLNRLVFNDPVINFYGLLIILAPVLMVIVVFSVSYRLARAPLLGPCHSLGHLRDNGCLYSVPIDPNAFAQVGRADRDEESLIFIRNSQVWQQPVGRFRGDWGRQHIPVPNQPVELIYTDWSRSRLIAIDTARSWTDMSYKFPKLSLLDLQTHQILDQVDQTIETGEQKTAATNSAPTPDEPMIFQTSYDQRWTVIEYAAGHLDVWFEENQVPPSRPDSFATLPPAFRHYFSVILPTEEPITPPTTPPLWSITLDMPVSCQNLAPDGSILAVTTNDSITLYDLQMQTIRFSTPHSETDQWANPCVRISQQGRYLFVYDQGFRAVDQIKIIDAWSGEVVQTIDFGPVYDLINFEDFSDEQHLLVTLGRWGGNRVAAVFEIDSED